MEIKNIPAPKDMQNQEMNENEVLVKMAEELNATGAGVIVGWADKLIDWARSNSLWSLTFGTSCCAIDSWRLELLNRYAQVSVLRLHVTHHARRHDYGPGYHNSQNGSCTAPSL